MEPQEVKEAIKQANKNSKNWKNEDYKEAALKFAQPEEEKKAPSKVVKITQHREKTGVGIAILGQTCYINSTLQLLASIPEFVQLQKQKKVKNNPFSITFSHIIDRISSSKKVRINEIAPLIVQELDKEFIDNAIGSKEKAIRAKQICEEISSKKWKKNRYGNIDLQELKDFLEEKRLLSKKNQEWLPFLQKSAGNWDHFLLLIAQQKQLPAAEYLRWICDHLEIDKTIPIHRVSSQNFHKTITQHVQKNSPKVVLIEVDRLKPDLTKDLIPIKITENTWSKEYRVEGFILHHHCEPGKNRGHYTTCIRKKKNLNPCRQDQWIHKDDDKESIIENIEQDIIQQNVVMLVLRKKP